MTKLAILSVLLLPQIANVKADDNALDENDVKDAIQDATASYVCGDEQFLNSVDLDYRTCRSEVAKYAISCWKTLDGVVSDYVTSTDDSGFDELSDISDLFIHCIQAKMLMSEISFRGILAPCPDEQ